MTSSAGLRVEAGPDGEVEPPYYRTDGPYRGRAPYFYDVETFPWARRVRERWQEIRAEFEENGRRGRDGVVAVFNPAGAAIPGWRSVNFQTYLWRYHRAWRTFPVTVGVLEAVPDLTSAFINVLEPQARIPPHQGDSQAIIRFHLGLDVPDGDCAIRVGGETRRCANGKLLAFSDAHEHSSWNATGENRVVMVFDVLRPEYRSQRQMICANVLSATAVLWLEKHLRQQRPLPPAVRRTLRRSLGAAFRAALVVQRRASL
jgi:aspartyl/asparaginyl beta-hydroxylase (cupin superfamily)